MEITSDKHLIFFRAREKKILKELTREKEKVGTKPPAMLECLQDKICGKLVGTEGCENNMIFLPIRIL